MRSSPHDELARLRKYRASRRPNLSIAAEVEKVRKVVVRRAGALGGLDEEWGELVPRALAGLARPEKLTPGGTLTVRAKDSSAVYEFDQWVRGGGLAVLRGACTTTLRNVKVIG